MFLLFVACSTDDEATTTSRAPTVDAPATDRCAGLGPCVDAAAVQPTLPSVAGHVVGWPMPVGDVNGDATDDWLFQPYVLFGPIELPLDFPGDADATVILAGDAYPPFVDFGDYDEDGAVDLLSEVGLLRGPLAFPTLDLAGSDGPVAPYDEVDWTVDVDGDGLAEAVHMAGDTLSVVPIGPDGWALGPPSLVLQFAPSDLEYSWFGAWLKRVEDVDGDGVAELCVVREQAWLLPADITGEVDLQALAGATCPVPLGDQDGDGTGDFALSEAGLERVLRGPLTSGPAGWTGEELFVLSGTSPLGFDASGDGVTDFLAYESPVPDVPNYFPYQQVALYTGGVGGGVETGEAFVRVLFDGGGSLDGVLPTTDGPMLVVVDGTGGFRLVSVASFGDR